MIIRKLNKNDFHEFCRIMALFYEHARNNIPSDDNMKWLFGKAIDSKQNLNYFGAFEGEKLIGIISITFAESSYKVSPFAWCDDFYVENEFRGMGIGTKLLEACTEIAKLTGCSNILIGAGEEDAEALQFYKSHGFIDLKCRLLSLPLD
jgi:GNAT superfamily N-acetyltransferase